MIVYFDTSALLPLVVLEPGSDIAGRLWTEADHVVSSQLIVVESAAAIAMGHRIGRMSAEDHDLVQNESAALVRELILVDVTPDVVEHAAALAVRRALRGYDAVHLATANRVGLDAVVFASGDRALLAAASAEGFHTVDTATRRASGN